MKAITSALLLVALIGLHGSLSAAETRYVTDEFEVTLRSGTSTSNSIVRMLKSGEPVTLLEQDLASKYSLVETADNRKGYILSRFLEDLPSARQRLADLQLAFEKLQGEMSEQKTSARKLRSELTLAQTDNSALKKTLRASEEELSAVRNAAANTLEILEQNKQMETQIAQLRTDKQLLGDENAELKDSTKLDWFIRGGAVSLIAFVIGILVTRIRWRKQDSWGSY